MLQFWDLHLSISDGFGKTKIYDKRDDFDSDIYIRNFVKFYRRHFDKVSKYNVGLKILLLQGISDPEVYGT